MNNFYSDRLNVAFETELGLEWYKKALLEVAERIYQDTVAYDERSLIDKGDVVESAQKALDTVKKANLENTFQNWLETLDKECLVLRNMEHML